MLFACVYIVPQEIKQDHLVQLVRMSQLVRPLLLLSLGRPTRMRNEMLNTVDKVVFSYKPKVAGTVDKVELGCQDPPLLAQPKDTLEFLLIPHGRTPPHQLMTYTFLLNRVLNLDKGKHTRSASGCRYNAINRVVRVHCRLCTGMVRREATVFPSY